MKKLFLITLLVFSTSAVFCQVMGNSNYLAPVYFSENNIDVQIPTNGDVVISVKGMANVKADAYVAIFSVTQQAETAEEVNRLMDDRINQALALIQLKPNVETYIDMISFVPVFEYEVTKKKFSRKTYNEIPIGFELKKNVHIKFSNPNQLNEFIQILSTVEIYDLVRVDYFAAQMDSIKRELSEKAQVILKEKLKDKETLLQMKFDTLSKRVLDGYRVLYPVEMYKSYQAYNNSSLNLNNRANVTQTTKSTTNYYQPILNKEFDFILNPVILEPVIQVLYEIQMTIKYNVETRQVISKEYFIVTPTGEVKKLEVK
ncbi:MAG: hypothetical protein H6Q25_931 [Bacteroidetes bacterium]|nr:hypothetical protein [Bacteroidota bacterium]